MKQATSEHTTTRQSEPTTQQDASAGPNGISIAPPAYGIDFVDRDLADAGSLSVNPPSLIQAKPMTAPPDEGSGTPRGYKKNKTGLPDRLKAGVETLSGLAMDDVKVPYNADKPVPLQAYAYVQGKDIQLKRMEGEEIQSIHAAAAAGVQGTGHPLPHFDKIQKSFGQHDVSGVQAFTDAKAKNASRDIGAKAYTTGHKVAFFRVSPDLHTTAHEATHALQQQAGVQLQGGVGEVGDRYERHADAVADKVVKGQSAEGLLNKYGVVQRDSSGADEGLPNDGTDAGVSGSGSLPRLRSGCALEKGELATSPRAVQQQAKMSRKAWGHKNFNATADFKGTKRGAGGGMKKQIVQRTVHTFQDDDNNDVTVDTGTDVSLVEAKTTVASLIEEDKIDGLTVAKQIKADEAEDNDYLLYIHIMAMIAPESVSASGLSAGAMQAKVKTKDDIATLTLDEINLIDPQSEVPYYILHDVLSQSWHIAKATLATPEGTGDVKEKKMALMRKLWWYRQWHHDQVLEETKTEVNQTVGNDRGLTHWFAAGSTTLTSDIDVNLKGEQTETAVTVFNEIFKTGVPTTQPWDYEAGVVYDVNVYAMDFIFDPIRVEDDILLGGKEAGGFPDISTEEKKKDIVKQNIWSLVKLRLYMSAKKWSEYKKSIGIRGSEVEQKYNNYFVTLRDRMITEAAVNGDDLKLNENDTGMQQLTSISEQLAKRKQVTPDELHPVAENLVIGASNRIYEDMLGSVARLRRQLRELIDVENEEAIGKKLTKLRNKLSEAAFFANEAYVTDAAVTQTVVGIQQKKGIRQPMFELMSAVNENLADALKEMTRHSGSLGEAAFKSAKYIFRMTEAAKSMDIKGGQVKTFNDVSFKISKEIKGTTEEEREKEDASKAVLVKFRLLLSITNVKSLMRKITGLAQFISEQYNRKFKDPTQQAELGKPYKPK